MRTKDRHKERTFEVTIAGVVTLHEWEIWPDGDAPEHPTARDVVKVMEQDGRSPLEVLLAWNLACDFELVVRHGTDVARWRL